MHCHCGTNNRAPRWTFTDPCKAEVRPGAREESASPVWLAASAMKARDTTKVYIWRLDSVCGPTLYRKCHSHNTPGKRHNNTWVEPRKTKRRRSDSVIWQKPLHQQKCQKGKVTTQTTPQKSSIKQQLRTDLGRSVGVTTATQLVWLTGLRFKELMLCHWAINDMYSINLDIYYPLDTSSETRCPWGLLYIDLV